MRPPLRRALAMGALLAWTAAGLASAAAPPPARGSHGMVASPDVHATRAALRVLRDGGNAVDAAIAAAFTLTVTYPLAAPIGGGGFLLFRDASGQVHALDFRERAPRALRAEMFLDEDGRPVPDRSLRGGLGVGTPGTVAGLAHAHDRWGTGAWPRLLAEATHLADDGFEVGEFLASALDARAELLGSHPATAAIFSPGGAPLQRGDRLVQRDLSATLRAIAQKGPDGFYRGAVARALEATVHRHEGVLDRKDLRAYRAVEREPLSGTYRGHRVWTFPPPSSGGVALLQLLGMFERRDLAAAGLGSSRTVHLMAEAERRVYADRARWLGDPDFFEVPLDDLLAPDYLARRLAEIVPDRATPSSAVPAWGPDETGETLHLSVADAAGGVASMTLTLNGWFGTGIVARGTGVLLNNELDDFSLAPGVPNQYGLLGGEANAVEAGKRPLSSMTPTIVESRRIGARPRLVLGTPGGATIITSVAQVIVNVVDHGLTLPEAIGRPRFHHQGWPDRILHERHAFPEDVARALEARGHRLEAAERPIGNVNAVGAFGPGGDSGWVGYADPRRHGHAEGY